MTEHKSIDPATWSHLKQSAHRKYMSYVKTNVDRHRIYYDPSNLRVGYWYLCFVLDKAVQLAHMVVLWFVRVAHPAHKVQIPVRQLGIPKFVYVERRHRV
jgi:hypothetical protein